MLCMRYYQTDSPFLFLETHIWDKERLLAQQSKRTVLLPVAPAKSYVTTLVRAVVVIVLAPLPVTVNFTLSVTSVVTPVIENTFVPEVATEIFSMPEVVEANVAVLIV